MAPESLAAVVITHDHVDHVYGFPHLVHALAIERCLDPVMVLAPAEALDTIDRALAAYGLIGDSYPVVQGDVVDPGERSGRQVAGMHLRTGWARHSRPTLALRCDIGGTSVGLTSDTLATTNLDGLFDGVHTLFHDCGGSRSTNGGWRAHHATAHDAGVMAARVGAQRLLLTHLPPLNGDLGERLLEEAGAAFAGQVVLATDGERVRFDT